MKTSAIGLFSVLAQGFVLLLAAHSAHARQGDSLESGLVIRYAFDGNFADSSGQGFNPTQRDVALTEDRFGHPNSACYFNGTSSYLYAASVPEPSDNAFTWSFWMRADDLASANPLDGQILINRCYAIGNNFVSPRVLVNRSGAVGFGSCCYASDVAGGFSSSSGRVVVEQWIHLAITSQRIAGTAGGVRRLFVNGQLAGSDSVPSYGQTDMNLVLIGADRFLRAGCFFKGAMDDLRIYNRELTQAEVRQLYGGPDCNGDGLGDWNQIASGELQDDNQNNVPDVCESTVTGVIPVSGASSGSTSVIINGTNFPQNPAVLIGGSSATNVVRVSANRITAVTPAGLPGMTSVTVGNWVQPNAFYYRPECGSDLDQDGEVTAADIAIVLLDFGPCYATATSTQPEDSTPFMLREQADAAAPRSR
jgi:hypothetical protein